MTDLLMNETISDLALAKVRLSCTPPLSLALSFAFNWIELVACGCNCWMQAKQADDSGLDSGHNSMNTGSDSASDSNSSEREEPPTQAARPRRLGRTFPNTPSLTHLFSDSFSLATNQRRQGAGRPPLPNMLPPATHV